MIKYLIVQLSPDSVSFCHNERNDGKGDLMSIELLRKVIIWSMQENLNVQFTFPDEEIPKEYHDVINMIDHTSIISSTCEDKELFESADVIVFDSWGGINFFPFSTEKSYVIRTTKDDLFEQARFIKTILAQADSLSIVITDICDFKDKDFDSYRKVLNNLIHTVVEHIKDGRDIHFNLLTDRIILNKMNNCGAGSESVTIAPDGKFYICPAFINTDKEGELGDFETGLSIRNPHLYKLEYAPICRTCDAYQCRRCIWLNRKMTLEVNTPSHEQCVVSHIERNASMELLRELKKLPNFDLIKEINAVDYLDPFDKIWFGNQNHNTQLT